MSPHLKFISEFNLNKDKRQSKLIICTWKLFAEPYHIMLLTMICEQQPHMVCHSNGWIRWLLMSMSWCNTSCVFLWWDWYWYQLGTWTKLKSIWFVWLIFFPDGHLNWGWPWPGRCLRDPRKSVPGEIFCQIPDFTLNASWCEIIHCHPPHPELLTMQIDGKRVVL